MSSMRMKLPAILQASERLRRGGRRKLTFAETLLDVSMIEIAQELKRQLW